MDLNFSMGQIVAGTIFSSIGFVAFVYGKKTDSWKPLAIGVGLFVIPFLLQDTLQLTVAGVILTSLLYFFRD